jgi:hypothetical protein
MKWTRGFMRLWGVLAACWIMAWLLTGGTQLLEQRFKGEAPINPVSGWRECPPNIEPKNKITPINPNDCSDSRNYEPDWGHRVTTIANIFVPPALILLLGFAVAWIARGFRRSAPPE